MGNFNRDNKFGGDNGGKFGKRNFGGGGFHGNRGSKPMHKVTCSKCGKECEVPFKPAGGRPVFCNDCFRTERNANPIKSGNNFGRPNFDRSNDGANKGGDQFKHQFEMLNSKLDKILFALAPASKEDALEKKEIKEKLGKKSKVVVKKLKPAKKALAEKK